MRLKLILIMATLVAAIHGLFPERDKKVGLSGSDAMNIQSNSRYHEVHARSLADPEGFWGEAESEID